MTSFAIRKGVGWVSPYKSESRSIEDPPFPHPLPILILLFFLLFPVNAD